MTGTIETVYLNKVEKKFKHVNDLRMKNLFCDVRFNVNGTIFPCHRLILATMSPYFQTMFTGSFKESNSDTITMNEIETEAFEEILNAMYSASIRFSPSNAYFILKTSHLLQLEIIVDACVSYIMKNPVIDYFLIETCVFARNIDHDELYAKCISLIGGAIAEYGRTDSFKKIPFDVLKCVFKKSGIYDSEEEFIIMSIMRWSKENNASRKDIQTLLDIVKLRAFKFVNSTMMSELLVACQNKCFDDEYNECTSQLDINYSNHSNLPLKLHVDVINVTTGKRGWSILRTNYDFDRYVLSGFYPTNSREKKVCKVGTKLYCFEYIEHPRITNCFSYYDEDGIKTSLLLPPLQMRISEFELTAIGMSIYLVDMSFDLSFWLYNCETSTWQNILKETKYEDIRCINVSACIFSDNKFYIIAKKDMKLEKGLYTNPETNEIFTRDDYYVLSITYPTFIVEELAKIPLHPTDYRYSSICVFDRKIAVFGTGACTDTMFRTTKDNFLIFDLVDSKWLTDLDQMNGGYASSLLFHHDDAVYAVGNGQTLLPGGKYDRSSDKWIDLPHLPRRITISNTNNVVAVGKVFGFEV
ncbi:kelch repeat and BTB domain-containing protein 2-like [Planococcus citri]|uniref:kelch repeat and BTB domain-containing protein 2-like n=1 Tax=Planococcus citri TaxID=170843 RepID=UPI0031F9A99A